jgi:hypothetical protein
VAIVAAMLCQLSTVFAQKLPPPFYFPEPSAIIDGVTAAGILAGSLA